MIEDEKQIARNEGASASSDKDKSKLNAKVFIFGIPLFMIQLVAVYFITANVLLKKIEAKNTGEIQKDSVTSVQKDSTKKSDVVLGKFIYSVEDVIVNPANTDGKRLLLTSVGFDVPDKAMNDELKKKDAIVKDAIISTLSSKNINQLSNINYRDSLKTQISLKLIKQVPDVKINKVYFTKYIIQ